MILGEFDKERAKNEAISFLSKSVTTLSLILGISPSDLNKLTENPFSEDSPFHASFKVLKHEINALDTLLDNNNE